ncbi:MAG: tudor domain-containing protein [Thermoleophilia bacterium]
MAATATFKKGDKVRDIKFGKTYTVISQRGSLMVFVEELCNGWIHPGNLRLIPDAAGEPND